MRKIKTVFPVVLFLLMQSLAAQSTVTLKVVVDSIQIFRGSLLVAVYNNRDEYKVSQAYQKEKMPVTGNKGLITFILPAYDNYAVALFQDINENDSLDTRGSMGIPTEPFGFSNNRRGAFGPPGFSAISFRAASDTTIIIHLVSTRDSFFKRSR